jgi:hypothetical protein
MTQVITNKDGRMETVKDGPKITPEDLARQRRALRDMLDGNTPSHEDAQAEKADPSDVHGRMTATEISNAALGMLSQGEEKLYGGAAGGDMIYIRTPLPSISWRKAVTQAQPKKDEPGLYLDSGEFVPASQVNRGWQ